MSVALKRQMLFDVDTVAKMVELGVLEESAKVELLHGVLVETSPQGPVHSGVIGMLADALRESRPSSACVREEKPVRMSRLDQPEPDISVVMGTQRDWLDAHPGGADLLLVVEVAWTSQDIDREKAEVYSRGQVRELWLLDVPARQLTVLREPDGRGGWASTQVVEDHDHVEPLFGGGRILLSSVLP